MGCVAGRIQWASWVTRVLIHLEGLKADMHYVAVYPCHTPPQWLLLGRSDTGHRLSWVCRGIYWRWQDGICRADVTCCHDNDYVYMYTIPRLLSFPWFWSDFAKPVYVDNDRQYPNHIPVYMINVCIPKAPSSQTKYARLLSRAYPKPLATAEDAAHFSLCVYIYFSNITPNAIANNSATLHITLLLAYYTHRLWMKVRSQDWWERVVMMEFDEWKENSWMSQRSFYKLCNIMETIMSALRSYSPRPSAPCYAGCHHSIQTRELWRVLCCRKPVQ